MNKPKYIQSRVETTINFDLDEIGVDWDKVKNFLIRDEVLTIYYKDGKQEKVNDE